MSRVARGRFITIEGGEGTGKSTLVAGLKNCGAFADAVFTREPGGSQGAEDIRALLVTGEPDRWDAMTELLLLNAARHDHVACTIEPALAAGITVLCDRYLDSTRVYQGARGVARGTIDALHDTAVGLMPDMTIILDAPAETGLARSATRDGPDRFERMGIPFHGAIREGFQDIAASESTRCVVVDATLDPEDVLERVTAILTADG